MTVIQETTAAERVAQALEYLDEAEAKFGAGDTRQAAEDLYIASVQAVMAASIQRGWDYYSTRANKNATFRLAKEYDDPFLAAGSPPRRSSTSTSFTAAWRTTRSPAIATRCASTWSAW